MLPPADLDRLASMPTRAQALSSLMGVLQAPVTKLVRTMAEPTAKLVRTFAAVRDQKAGRVSRTGYLHIAEVRGHGPRLG
jgi:large subunit ribosomal protein L10